MNAPDAVTSPPRAAVVRTDLPLPGRREGKVRDLYELPAGSGRPPRVVIVATDRISAFDVVLPTPIPGKGCLLSEMSVRWFEFLRGLNLIPDHLLSTDPAHIDGLGAEHRAQVQDRLVIGRAAVVIPVEFVVRGYLAGSGWREYTTTGRVCGVELPEALARGAKLPEPIFTPATKATEGHDENIDFERACAIAGGRVMERLREVSLEIYRAGAEYAAKRGLILADTKFEFGYALDESGRRTDEVILIDEVLTPDSSRYWPAEKYAPGQEQENFDKQYVRNYLQALVDRGTWDKTPPGPALPDEVVANTLARYLEARDRLFR